MPALNQQCGHNNNIHTRCGGVDLYTINIGKQSLYTLVSPGSSCRVSISSFTDTSPITRLLSLRTFSCLYIHIRGQNSSGKTIILYVYLCNAYLRNLLTELTAADPFGPALLLARQC